MTDKSDNPFMFWEELKRRKVVRVIIGYGAAAFVIIELINNITEPLNLPDWVPTLVIVLLAIGFLIAIVMSWIFDVTSEGIKKTESSKSLKGKPQPGPTKRKLRVSDIIIGMLLMVVILLLYPRVLKKDKFKDIRDEAGKISVAVLPYKYHGNDTLLNYWQEGIQELLIGNLSNTQELSVRTSQTIYEILESTENTNYASMTPSIARDISRRISANTLIQGSIIPSGDNIRINTQLINSGTGEIYKTFQLDGNKADNLLLFIDTLSTLIKEYFQISLMHKDLSYDDKKMITTSSPEAIRYYIIGMRQGRAGDWEAAIESFKQAYKLDSSAYDMIAFTIGAYSNDHQYREAKRLSNYVFNHRDYLSYDQRFIVDFWKYKFDKNPEAYIKTLKQSLEYDPHQRLIWYQLGLEYFRLVQDEKSIESFEKVLELDKQWGAPLEWSATYTNLGRAYHELGNHKREKEVYELGLSIFPDYYGIIKGQAICAISQGDTIRGNELIERYISLYNEENEAFSAHSEKYSIGLIYSSANEFEKAEQFFRQALEINPDFAYALNNLAINLFKQNKNLNEGMDLINKALKIYPESATYLHTKGKGLYKLGKPEEALELFKKAWDLQYYYYHDHYLDIQEAKQALARQKSEQN